MELSTAVAALLVGQVFCNRSQLFFISKFPTYVQVCTQMRKLRFLRKIAKIVNGAKKKTNPQLGLAIFAKIAIFAIFCKNR